MFTNFEAEQHLPWPSQSLASQEAQQDECDPNRLDARVICGEDNGQRDKRSSGQQRNSEPPAVKTKSEDQEAEATDQVMLLGCTPNGNFYRCKGAQSKEAQYTDQQ